MNAKEMFQKQSFYKMEESHYVCGITYIRTVGKEYQEISFYEEIRTIYTVIENLKTLEDELISAINEQILELKLKLESEVK